MVETEFIQPYRDVQYYCLTSITGLATETYNKNENPVVVDDDDDSRDSQEKEDVTVRADRLLELLMLIPVPTSQDELVQERGGANGGNHLIPPPTRQQQQQILPPGENEDVDGSNDDDSDFDSDDDDCSSSDSDSDNQRKAKRPSKKAKKSFQKKKKNLNLLPFQQLRAFKREYQRAWLAVLRLPLSTPALKRALNFLPQHVLNYVNHPLRFSDFFMQAYSDNDENTGGGSGIIGVLALDGLFQLITQYDLEYPNFYKQLYKLVTAKVMHVKYRARFFDLLNRCLVRNEMLPAHVVAAFIKRLCRCAISSPPPAILFVLALVSNLIRKHPECSCLIHRRNKKAQSSEVLEIVDGYDAEQDDPVKSGALQSSLWELSALERHYYPAVATMAKSVGTTEEIDAPAYNVMADFVQHTYSSLFDQERKRYHHQPQQQNNDKSSAADDMYNAKKRKITKTALVFKEPTSLFTDSDVFADFLSL
jgi:U3 small nucleolar RNA-associated protein 19